MVRNAFRIPKFTMTLGRGRLRPEGPMGLVLALIILIYTPNLLAGEKEDSRPQCTEEVLADAAAEKKPRVYTRENIRYGVGRAHPKDLFHLLALQSGGVMGSGALERVPRGIDDPRLGHPEAQRIRLLAPNGDEVALVFIPDLGQGRAFLIMPGLVVMGLRLTADRVYLVQTEARLPSGTEKLGPMATHLRLAPESRYREGVNWADLDEATRERLGREMGRRTTAVDQAGGAVYRTAVTPPVVEAVPLRVRMPTGKTFTQVDDPHFRELGMSYRDDTTGLIWSQAFKETMTWEEANAACKKIGGRLPTVGELATWVSHLGNSGKVLNHLFPRDTRWFWLSWRFIFDPGDAVFLYAYSGRTDYDLRLYGSAAVRCVR